MDDDAASIEKRSCVNLSDSDSTKVGEIFIFFRSREEAKWSRQKCNRTRNFILCLFVLFR